MSWLTLTELRFTLAWDIENISKKYGEIMVVMPKLLLLLFFDFRKSNISHIVKM